MKITKSLTQIIATVDDGTELALRIRTNTDDGMLQVMAPNGTVWASSFTIQGLKQLLYGMTIEAKDLGDGDGDDSGS